MSLAIGFFDLVNELGDTFTSAAPSGDTFTSAALSGEPDALEPEQVASSSPALEPEQVPSSSPALQPEQVSPLSPEDEVPSPLSPEDELPPPLPHSAPSTKPSCSPYLQQGEPSSSTPHWQQAPNTLGRSSGLTMEAVAILKEEEALARKCYIPWQERGPPGPEEGGPRFWRGQQWREGKNGGQQRFSNRGGKYKEYYANLARIGMVGGKGKAAGKSKGTGKDEDNATNHEWQQASSSSSSSWEPNSWCSGGWSEGWDKGSK